MNSNTKIRKLLEQTCYNILNPEGIYIDFNEEGGDGNNEFVRVNTPFVITDTADIGSKLKRHDGTITIQIFAQTKTRAIEIYDTILNNIEVGKKLEGFEIKMEVSTIYTEMSNKDSAGGFYQINAGLDFNVYTL